MAVKIGTVATFADAKPDKTQVVKILEESAEIFGAWQKCNHYGCMACLSVYKFCSVRECIALECADTIQAICNLLAAYGIDDLTAVLDRCKQKNIERGREYGI